MQARDAWCKVLACVALVSGLAACGGGGVDAPNTAATAGAMPQALQAQPRRLGAKVAGPAGTTLSVYQALFGKAPSYTQFNTLWPQAEADPAGFAVAQAASLSGLSDSALAVQVLANMNVSNLTVGANTYATLRDIVTQLFGVYGPSSRGVIVLNLTNILAALEGDANYGFAAAGFNVQVLADYNYSVSSANSVAAAVTPPVHYTGQAQGLYAGTLGTNNYTLNLLMLENDEGYALYGQTTNSIFLVYGLLRMDGVATLQSYASANVRDYTGVGTVNTYTLGASYSPATSFSGGMATGAGTLNFATTAVPASVYNYNTPAQLASIAGAWPGALLNGSTGALTITASGGFSGTLGGCALSGTLAPRASGKNVFNLNAAFGTTGCLSPGAVVSGVAINYTNAAGQKQLLMAMTTADHNQGTTFVGLR